MKKYYATFSNGKVSCFFERKDGDDFPYYLKKEDIKELTQDQYENINLLSLVNDEIILDELLFQSIQSKKVKQEKKEFIKQKIKKMTNNEISNLDAAKKNKILLYLIDSVFDRDEIFESEDL